MNRAAKSMAPLLFGSGACALVYQTVWLREFRLVFGASTAANAAVLAVFIGGLGVGGMVLGGRADRHARPLSLYATLELFIAVWSAATPALLWLTRHVYIAVGGSLSLGLFGGTLARLILATLVLGGPTVLMGGTLPAVARGVETVDDRGRRSLGLLYGLNTLGAVAGCLLATFVLLEVFGSQLTLWLACLVNLLIAVFARVWARALLAPPPAESPEVASTRPEWENPHAPANTHRDNRGPRSDESGEEAPLPSWLTLAAAAAVGFAFFLMELVWYRMLGPLLGGTVFSFGLILAVALLGIGLGGAFYSTFGRARASTVGGFALTCSIEAACIAVPYALGDRIAVLALYLRPLGTVGFGGFLLGWTAVTLIVVFPAAFVAGLQFPLLIGLLGKGRASVGRQVGLAYAANTGGSIVGALAGGFGLIPALSAPGCWRAVAWLLAALGVIAAGFAARRRLRPWALAGQLVLFAVVAGSIGATGPTAVWRHSPIGVGRVPPASMSSRTALHSWMSTEQRAILWQADGIESSVAMARTTGLAFVLNGKVDGHVRIDAATQVMSGLVGAALHPDPKSAMVIGLGTGSTAGWLAAIPSLERVDVAELEPKIVDVAEQCHLVNHEALANPKVHVMLGDAREILLTSRGRYDVISSEPSNPYRAGISSLFTQEYYRAVLDRLSPSGIFVQWVQAYNIDAGSIFTIYATLGSVFPSIETWELGTNDLLLVASMQPIKHDVSQLSARLAQEPFRSALARAWRTTRVEGFLAHFVANPALARALSARPGQLVNTDDLSPVEFGFARAAGNLGGFSADDVRVAARAHHQERPDVSPGNVAWDDVDDEWDAFKTSEQGAIRPRPDMGPDARARLRAETAFLAGQLEETARAWRSQPRPPAGPTELAMLSFALASVGDDAALPLIDRLAALEPIEADMVLGRLRAQQGKLAEAAAVLIRAFEHYRSDPWPWPVIAQHALDSVVGIAVANPALAGELHAALREPFAARLMDDARTLALTMIAMRMDPAAACLPTLAEIEPYVPWRLDVLAWRSTCYEKLNHPNAARAAKELAEYLSEQPASFANGMRAPGGP